MTENEFSNLYADYLENSYDCVDRIVLNAYFFQAQSGGGFRVWWRKLMGSDEHLNNTQLMRFAGRFSRRVHAYAQSNGIPLIHCERDERKHEIAATHLPSDPIFQGLFCILAGRAQAPVREIKLCSNHQPHIQKKIPQPWVNHYSFHILDPHWGHLVIKLCPHPPFNAQIILNGHDYVAIQARKSNISFTKEGNCFTHIDDAPALDRVADAMSDPFAVGRLVQVCERWIYSTCLCFALTIEEQQRSGFHYGYSVYQSEYSQNLLFHRGRDLDHIFNAVIDRVRSPLGIKTIRTIFGNRHRPSKKKNPKARLEVVVEKPVWNLTVFKLHFGKLTAKLYSKGERVLRIEAIVHNARELRCGIKVHRFPKIVAALKAIVERFMTVLGCVDASFIDDGTLDSLPLPSMVGASRVAGIDINNPRMRALMAAAVALAPIPKGFTLADLAAKVSQIMGTSYSIRQAAYDSKKLRAKGFIRKIKGTRRNEGTTEGLKAMAALHVLREKVIKPLFSGCTARKIGRKPKNWSMVDQHYEAIRVNIQQLFPLIGIAA